MKLGFTYHKAFSVKDLASFGFDFLEMPLPFLASLSKDEKNSFLAMMKDAGITADSCCSFFRRDLPLLGGNEVLPLIREETKRNLALAEEFGIRIVVIGSGAARSVPEDCAKEDAMARFADVIRPVADLCEEKGMRLVIEPLRRSETNFINTVLDGKEIASYIRHPAVGCLVDFFHLYTNGEDPETILSLKGSLIHAHFARPDPDRLPPKKEDEETVRLWMEKLREIGYDDRLVLECTWKNAAPDYFSALFEMRPLLPLLKGEKNPSKLP